MIHSKRRRLLFRTQVVPLVLLIGLVLSTIHHFYVSSSSYRSGSGNALRIKKQKIHSTNTRYSDKNNDDNRNVNENTALRSMTPNQVLQHCQHHFSFQSVHPNNHLLDFVENVKHNENNTILQNHQSSSSTFSSSSLTLLVIGDSLDRNMVRDVCQLIFHGRQDFFFPKLRPNICHGKVILGNDNATTTTTLTFRIAYVNIFGMVRPCGSATSIDPRPYNTTQQRLQVWLPRILAKLQTLSSLSALPLYYNTTTTTTTAIGNGGHPLLPQNTIDYILLGSSHWDLSTGCTEDHVTMEYRQEYQSGMSTIVTTIQQILKQYHRQQQQHLNKTSNNNENYEMDHDPPISFSPPPIYWRTAPPISQQYSAIQEASGRGRTRSNQQVLNALLKQQVACWQKQAGGNDHIESTRNNNTSNNHQQQQQQQKFGVVDWWQLIMDSVPSEEDLNEELALDGRHYSSCPNLAFFNAWLNVLQ